VQVAVQDATIEALQESIKNNPNGALCSQDELGGFFAQMDRPGRELDRSFYIQAYNGGPYTVQRIGRGFVRIENLSLSMIGGIQPEPIRKVISDSVDDGLVQRLLPIVLRSAVKGRDEPASEILSEYSDLIHRLRALNETTLRFDDGAQVYREKLEERHLELQDLESIDPKLGAHIGKYDGMFARLCIVFHCIEHARMGQVPSVISEGIARRAGDFLHKFFLPHALAFYGGTLGLSNNHSRLASIAGYILSKKLKEITNNTVKSNIRQMRRTSTREVEEVMSELRLMGWVEQSQQSQAVWTVNPVVHTMFNERAEEERIRRAIRRETIRRVFGGETGE
jgi:hypothetical protein